MWLNLKCSHYFVVVPTKSWRKKNLAFVTAKCYMLAAGNTDRKVNWSSRLQNQNICLKLLKHGVMLRRAEILVMQLCRFTMRYNILHFKHLTNLLIMWRKQCSSEDFSAAEAGKPQLMTAHSPFGVNLSTGYRVQEWVLCVSPRWLVTHKLFSTHVLALFLSFIVITNLKFSLAW